MSRLRLTLAAVALTMAGFAGCRQHCFMTEADFHNYRSEALNSVRTCPTPQAEMDCSVDVKSVTTVLSPEAEPRLISITECIALALENGRSGEFLDRAASTRNGSPASNVTDSLRVFAY